MSDSEECRWGSHDHCDGRCTCQCHPRRGSKRAPQEPETTPTYGSMRSEYNDRERPAS